MRKSFLAHLGKFKRCICWDCVVSLFRFSWNCVLSFQVLDSFIPSAMEEHSSLDIQHSTWSCLCSGSWSFREVYSEPHTFGNKTLFYNSFYIIIAMIRHCDKEACCWISSVLSAWPTSFKLGCYHTRLFVALILQTRLEGWWLCLTLCRWKGRHHEAESIHQVLNDDENGITLSDWIRWWNLDGKWIEWGKLKCVWFWTQVKCVCAQKLCKMHPKHYPLASSYLRTFKPNGRDKKI